MLGDHKAFDTSGYFVVCCNILGSWYASAKLISINPKTGNIYGNVNVTKELLMVQGFLRCFCAKHGQLTADVIARRVASILSLQSGV